MTEPTEPHVEYMFGILGYDTWILCDGDAHIGVVTLNGPDNTVNVTFHDNFEPWMAFFADRSFKWWMQFVRDHFTPATLRKLSDWAPSEQTHSTA